MPSEALRGVYCPVNKKHPRISRFSVKRVGLKVFEYERTINTRLKTMSCSTELAALGGSRGLSRLIIGRIGVTFCVRGVINAFMSP